MPNRIEKSPPKQEQLSERNNYLSFGINHNSLKNEDSFSENITECVDSPNNKIQSSLQNHHFFSNQNNIAYLNSNQNCSSIQDDLQNLENELKYYQEIYEITNKNYESLRKNSEILKIEQKPKEIPIHFNPFLKNPPPQNNENSSILKNIKELESELSEWKLKYEILEKEHLAEMSELKVFLKNSQISDSTNHITSNNQNVLSKLNEKLEVLKLENDKINNLIREILNEINFLNRTNPILKERHENFQRIFSRIEQTYQQAEQNLQNEITASENELNLLKESSNMSQLEPFESLIINNSTIIVPPEKKIEFLENENKKLENEIESWKIQYRSLEKKVKINESLNNPELKYTEIDLKDIVNKVNRNYFNTQNELLNKMTVLEIEINKLSKKNYGNSINSKRIIAPTRGLEVNNASKPQLYSKYIQSEKKDKTSNLHLGLFKTIKPKIFGNNGKLGIYSNSLGNSNNNVMMNVLSSLRKKESIITKNMTYTEKILRKMKK